MSERANYAKIESKNKYEYVNMNIMSFIVSVKMCVQGKLCENPAEVVGAVGVLESLERVQALCVVLVEGPNGQRGEAFHSLCVHLHSVEALP